MAFTHVQTSSLTVGTGQASLTGVTAGNLLVCHTGNANGFALVTAVSDSGNGSWDLADGIQQDGCAVYYFEDSAAGNITVTVTAGSTIRVHLSEYSHTGSISLADTATNSSSGSSVGHGAIAVTGAALILTSAMCDSAFTDPVAATDFTLLNDGSQRFLAQRRITAGDYSGDAAIGVTGSPGYASAIIALQESGGASTSHIPAYLSMLRSNQ